MQLLPLAFTAFLARFPAGLFVYWLTSNTVTLLQNYLVYHRGLLGRSSQSPQKDTDKPADQAVAEPIGAPKAAKQGAKKSGSRKRRKKKKK